MDARELKERLGNRAMYIIAEGLGQRLDKHKKIVCPFHSDHDPSLSWYEQGNTFKCLACNETMDIYRYYTEFEGIDFVEAKQKIANIIGIELAYKGEKKTYTKPKEKHEPLTDTIVKFLKTRGISKEIAEYWDIESEFINGKEVMVFKHNDQRGKLVLNAYREVESKEFQRQTGNKTILFGMDKIDFKKPCIIVEGHLDALSVSMVYKNVVSVPAGINNTDWIENCWAFIDKVDKFIFWADNDKKNGISLAEKIRSRIGKEKCTVEFHQDYKDANELLMAEGVEGIEEFIEEATMPKVEGLINMGRRKSNIGEIEKFKCGFYDIDRHLNSLEYGCLSVIFGRDNEGKSTFISQMIAELLKTQKVFLYSGEMTEYKIEDWIMSQIISGDEKHLDKYRDEWGEELISIKSNAKQAICKWYRDKFFLYECKMEANVSSGLFKVMDMAHKVYGVRMFFIDNIMAAVDDSNEETNKAEMKFMKAVKQFAITYNVHVFVVAHPNKEGSIEHKALNKVDVNGSKVITNIADYVFAVERSWNPQDDSLNEIYRKPVEGEKNKYYTSIVRILKNRAKKPRKDLYYRFHTTSLRFFNDEVNKSFGGNWRMFLKPEPKTVKYYNGTEQTFEHGEVDNNLF